MKGLFLNSALPIPSYIFLFFKHFLVVNGFSHCRYIYTITTSIPHLLLELLLGATCQKMK